jgi:positive regulator of sigma E activity
MKESKGYVMQVGADGKVRVMVETEDSAGGCASPKEDCHCSGRGGRLAIKVENRAGAREGDYVTVLFKPGAVLKSVLILLGIPLIGVLAGAITGTALNERSLVSPNQAFLAGVGCFAFAVFAAALIYRGVASELQPFVDRILSSGSGTRAFGGVDPVCGRPVDPLNAAAKIDESFYPEKPAHLASTDPFH